MSNNIQHARRVVGQLRACGVPETALTPIIEWCDEQEEDE